MLVKYALAVAIVLCLTMLGLTLLVGDPLCEFTVEERNIELRVVLAYEPRKWPLCRERSPYVRLSGQDGKTPVLHFRPQSVMATDDFVLSDGCGRFRFKSNDEFYRWKSKAGLTV